MWIFPTVKVKVDKFLLEILTFPLTVQNNVDRKPVPSTELSSEISETIWARLGRGNSAETRDQFTLFPLSLRDPADIYLPNICILSPWELPSSLSKSQITTPNILFCLLRKIIFKVKVLAILVSFCSLGSLPCLYVIKFLSDFFFLLICLMSILFLRTARRS